MKLIFAAVLLCVGAHAKNLPSYITPCKRTQADFNVCFIKEIRKLMPMVANGVPDLAIPSLNPYIVPFVSMDSGSGGSFQMDLEITNASLTGLGNFAVEKVNMDFANDVLSCELSFPHVKVTGKYKASGKILVIPINGGGDITLNFEKNTIIASMKGTKFMKKGKEHYKFEKTEFDIKVTDGNGNFGNLFANNQELTDSTNKVFNENFNVAVEEFKPPISKLLEAIMLQIMNNVHSKFSIDELYPK